MAARAQVYLGRGIGCEQKYLARKTADNGLGILRGRGCAHKRIALFIPDGDGFDKADMLRIHRQGAVIHLCAHLAVTRRGNSKIKRPQFFDFRRAIGAGQAALQGVFFVAYVITFAFMCDLNKTG